MFTGLISAVGVAERAGDGSLFVRCPQGFLQGAAIGASIAVDGVCLTATQLTNDAFTADLSPETIQRCAPWQSGQKVNLERPLRAGDEIGGHFVAGHIDGVAEVTDAKEDGNNGMTLHIKPPPKLSPLITEKGSVALSGVSLTIGEVGAHGTFAAHIIPHTIQSTTIAEWRKGRLINIEADTLARYAVRR